MTSRKQNYPILRINNAGITARLLRKQNNDLAVANYPIKRIKNAGERAELLRKKGMRIDMDCIFCKIIKGEIPSKKIYEDENVFVFEDISPVAPIHYLAVPKVHISSAAEVTAENSVAIAKIFEAIGKIAKEKGLDEGFRIINNCGENAGQTVFHIHFHLLAGENFGSKLI